ncbi:MAG: MnhB domain-containing protein [Acidimicrobiia bacterium]
MNHLDSLILATLVRTIVRLALVFSLFLLFAGHNAPGGGFVGGLVASIALVISFVSRGPAIVTRFGPVTPEMVLGTGLVISALTGVGGWLWGEHFLETAKTTFTAPLLGEVAFTTSLPFDIGVYLVVFGLAGSILDTLGRVDEDESL